MKIGVGILHEYPFLRTLFHTAKFMAHNGRYILKFISGKYQGGEFALEMNKELIIGRSSELEMVLIEDMVSRHHAKITTTDDEIFIEDLGSTNGTFVNGEKITKTKLKEGDRILIGTSIIKLVSEDVDANQPPPPPSGIADISVEVKPQPQVSSTVSKRVQSSHTQHGSSGVLSGQINVVPLPDLLQLFGASKKTGGLFITTPGGTEGCIYLRDGRVYGAVINGNFDVPVEKAFYRIICWQQGTFILDNTAAHAFDQPINEDVNSMLMEAMRIIDETHNLGDDVPAFESIFKIELPLEPKLRDLSPEQLDIFQIALGEPSMEAILNKSPLDDIETTKCVIHLVQNKYLTLV